MAIVSRSLRWIAALVLVAGLGLGISDAHAQPIGEVVVLPVGMGQLAPALGLADLVEQELRNHGARVISLHDARDRFVSHSREPYSVSESELDAVASLARQASEHVAFGRTSAAERTVREVVLRAERALETLNRETATARHVLDACLALVRSGLQRGNREAALTQAMRCRRLVPDLVPSAEAHPVSVMGVLAEADQLLQRMRVGKLSVRSSVPSESCSVYLNGRHLGTTPFDLDRAAAGEYRVQVECGNMPGRVHIVRLGDEPVSLNVDVSFDRAIQTEPRLAVRRVSQSDVKEQSVSDALAVGETIGADEVVLAQVSDGRAILSRVHVEYRRVVARTITAWDSSHGAEPSALQLAVSGLIQGRMEEYPIAAGSVGSFKEPPPAENSARRPSAADNATRSTEQPRPGRPWSWRAAIDSVAVALGAGSFVAASALFLERRHEGERFRQASSMQGSSVSRYEAWHNTRAEPYLFAALGATLTTGGLLDLTLTAQRRPPRWTALLSGAAGLGLATWGLVDVARGASCNGMAHAKSCSDELEQRDRGAVVFLSSVPLLSFFAAEMVRSARGAAPRHVAWGIYPDVDPLQTKVVLRACVRWL